MWLGPMPRAAFAPAWMPAIPPSPGPSSSCSPTFAAIAASSCSGGHAREHAVCVGAALFLAQIGASVALAGFGLPPLVGRTILPALGATAAGVLVLGEARRRR
jgi:hypothetical protein